MIKSPSRPNSLRTNNKPGFFTIGAAVVGILSLGNTNASGQGLDESFFTPERLAEIFPRVPLEKVKEEFKKDIHEKIMTNPKFRSLQHIQGYALDELEKKGVQVTSLSVQIVPFYKDSKGNHNYLEISIVTKHETLNIPLSIPNSETAAVASILGEIINDFEKYIYEAALNTFNEEFENTNIFRRGTMERKIDDILKPKFESYIQNCMQYKGSKIIRGDDGKADIYVRYLDIPSGVICYMLVETDISIPSKVPNDGPMMMAQNTSGTQQ